MKAHKVTPELKVDDKVSFRSPLTNQIKHGIIVDTDGDWRLVEYMEGSWLWVHINQISKEGGKE
jgi:hypothetical protein